MTKLLVVSYTNSAKYPKSGDSPTIPLVEADHPPTEVHERWKVVEKMEMVTQYTFAGDYTGSSLFIRSTVTLLTQL